MPFVSQVLNRPVLDQEGMKLGLTKDFLFTLEDRYPPIHAIVFKSHGRLLVAPQEAVSSVTPRATILRGSLGSLQGRVQDFRPPEDDSIWLVRDVLDKQIVDTGGVRLVRVNDVSLALVNGELRIAGVDRSMLGILRQLIPGWTTLANRRGDIIDWDQLDLGPTLDVLRLRTPFAKLTRMRPADIAVLMSQMSPGEAADMLESLDDETAAQALTEMPEENQSTVLGAMEPQEAADVLEEMSADAAADVLGDIEEARARELMLLMEPAAASEVRSLLAYDEESAGGLMSNQFIAVQGSETAGTILMQLRERPPEDLETHSVHVIEPDGRLRGWLSLWDILLAAENIPVEQLSLRPDRARVEDDWEQVARRMLHYRLLSIPVVNSEDRMVGLVSSESIARRLTPRSWSYRP